MSEMIIVKSCISKIPRETFLKNLSMLKMIPQTAAAMMPEDLQVAPVENRATMKTIRLLKWRQ